MSGSRIKVTLYNRTFKEIDMSDFTRITEGIFSNRDDIVEVEFRRTLPLGHGKVERIGACLRPQSVCS